MNKIYIFGGLFVMLGAVGGLETETMSFAKALILSTIGGIYAVYGALQLNEEQRNKGE